MRWLRLLRWVSAHLSGYAIRGEDGSVYLWRFSVIGYEWRLPCALFLHRFVRPDNEERGVLHTHPWKWSVSLVLSGGYTEERINREFAAGPLASRFADAAWRRRFKVWHLRRVLPWRLNVFRAGSAHRIAELHGECWTLFLVGPKAGSWGFLVPGRGFVPWRERCAERGIPT